MYIYIYIYLLDTRWITRNCFYVNICFFKLNVTIFIKSKEFLERQVWSKSHHFVWNAFSYPADEVPWCLCSIFPAFPSSTPCKQHEQSRLFLIISDICSVRHAYAGQMCDCSEGDRQTPPHSSIPGQSVTQIYGVISRSNTAFMLPNTVIII